MNPGSFKKASFHPEKTRLLFMLGFCAILASIVIFRAAMIQVIGDPRLAHMAKRQFQSKVLIQPRRGLIVDRNGEPLAFNADATSLAANPAKVKNRKILARLLAKALDVSQSKIYERLGTKREFVWIKRHLSQSDINRLRHWKVLDHEDDLVQGLWRVNESKRIYPHGELASHLLGDVNLDNDGLEGTELWANETLRGKVVSVSAVRDALGRPTFIDASAANQVKDGEKIQLTIDASLQYSVEQELKRAIAKTSSRAGSVIVMNASSGEVIALANEPTFNPNLALGPVSNRRNRVFTDGYEPGSTLKAVLVASALNKGLHLSDQVYAEKGNYFVQGKKISEAEAHEKFEWISLKKMLQVSSNIGAAKFALKIGAEGLFKGLQSFGFGTRTGSGFPGEISGRVPPLSQWSLLSTANIGFGQGVLVTPMQMLRTYAVFANGGWLVQPTLTKQTFSSQRTDPPKRILSQKVADQVTEALVSVTQDGGTGTKAVPEGYTIAGKTGTAQVVDSETGKYSHHRYIASFIGFAVGVEPKYVIFTALDEPHGAYYAGETAAPLFRQVMLATAQRFSLPASAASPVPQHLGLNSKSSEKSNLSDQLQWSLAKAKDPLEHSESLNIDSHTQSGLMPNLTGLTSREAVRTLQGHMVSLEISGTGIVQNQIPEAGKPLTDGSKVKLVLGATGL